MKTFIYNHIDIHNNIITDIWQSYSFLDLPKSGYTHETFVQGPNGISGLVFIAQDKLKVYGQHFKVISKGYIISFLMIILFYS